MAISLGLNSKAIALAEAVNVLYLGHNPSTTDKGDGEMGMVWTVGGKTLMASVNENNKFTYSVTGELPTNITRALTACAWDSSCNTTMRQAAAAIGG